MINSPHLLEELRKQELKRNISFTARVHRYEEMHKIVGKLNPELLKKGSGKHLEHLVQLTDKFKKLKVTQKIAAK